MDSLVISLFDCANGKRLAAMTEARGDLGFDIRLSDGGIIYRTENFVGYDSRPPNRMKETRETYMQALQEAFQPNATQNAGPRSNFTYDFNISGSQLTFLIKQQLPGESHYLLFYKGEYNAVSNSAEEMLNLLENVNGILAAKDEEVNYIREDSQYFKDTIDTLQSDRDNFALWKETLQDKLIRGFCGVLNSKKREIARLQSELNALRGIRSTKKATSSRLETVTEEENRVSDDDASSVASKASTKRATTTRGKKTATATRGKGRKAAAPIASEEEDDNQEEEEEEESVPKAKRGRVARGVSLTAAKNTRGRKATTASKQIKLEDEEEQESDAEFDVGKKSNKKKDVVEPQIANVDEDATDDELPLPKWNNSSTDAPPSESMTTKSIVLEPAVSYSQPFVASQSNNTNLLFGADDSDEGNESERDLLAGDDDGDDVGAENFVRSASQSQSLHGGARSFPAVNATVSTSAAAVDGVGITAFLESQHQHQHQLENSQSSSRKRSAEAAEISHYDPSPPSALTAAASVPAPSITNTTSATTLATMQVRKKSKASKFLAEADTDDE